MVGRNAVHILRLFRHAAKKIASAHDDRQLHAHGMNIGDFRGDFVDPCDIDPEAAVGGQRLAGKLEKDSFVHAL